MLGIIISFAKLYKLFIKTLRTEWSIKIALTKHGARNFSGNVRFINETFLRNTADGKIEKKSLNRLRYVRILHISIVYSITAFKFLIRVIK